MRFALIDLTYPYRGRISHYSILHYRALTVPRQVECFARLRQYPTFLG
jgi:hypothetical protein